MFGPCEFLQSLFCLTCYLRYEGAESISETDKLIALSTRGDIWGAVMWIIIRYVFVRVDGRGGEMAARLCEMI